MVTEVKTLLANQDGGRIKDPSSVLGRELAFTRRCAEYWDSPREVREARTLELFLPALFQPIQPGDRFAGRVLYPEVGMSLEPGGCGYYCREANLLRLRNEQNAKEIDEILTFWSGKTSSERSRRSLSASALACLPFDDYFTESALGFPLYRIGGLMLDNAKLLDRGLPGMLQAARDHPKREWSSLVGRAYELVIEIAERYASTAIDPELRESLLHLAAGKPQGLRDGIQLIWLVSLAAGTQNYGRLDIVLGPLLDKDLSNGRLTVEQAQDLIIAFWRHIPTYDNKWNNRVIVGGRGSDGVAGADTFARLAIHASTVVRQDQPQLSLRFSLNECREIYGIALKAIAEGCTYPILYNDDVYIPAIREAFDTSEADAQQYLPFGCGEMMLDHRSVSSPNGVLNLPACLLAALDGRGSRVPMTLEELWDEYRQIVETNMRALAEHQLTLYRVTGEDLGFPLASSLIDDCEGRGQWLLGGGVRYLTGSVETYGNTNTSDSFAAIESTGVSLPDLRIALQKDWLGFENLRCHLIEAPKYGNDDDRADRWAMRVHEQVRGAAQEAGNSIGWTRHHVVIVNNSMNVHFGMRTGATPDGRHAGAAFANANNPNPGADWAGVTAMLNSLVKLDPRWHGGAVQNMKFSPELARDRPEQFRALLDTYFANGGAQAMITVVGRADLEAAIKNPSEWGHLMVRVGGFSARFVDLPKEVQLEILERTCHG